MSEEEKDKKKKGEESKLSSSPIALARELEDCQKKKDEYLAGWQRARADFLNYKKEEIERMENILKYANEELILKFLPILDNFYLIEKKLPEDLKKNDSVRGILQIKNQILDFLKKEGVEEIKTGERFDPNFQEAVEVADSEAEKEGTESGVILEVIQKGYTINGRLLRPAKVRVTK